MFNEKGLHPTGVRIMYDQSTQRSKGSAFVDFGGEAEAQNACALDGQKLGGAERPLRINPGNRN